MAFNKSIVDEKIATCPHCEGDGNEPEPIQFTDAQAYVLESGCLDKDWFIFIADNNEQSEAVDELRELKCLDLRSMTWREKFTVYMLNVTDKGMHLLRVYWKSPEYKRKKRNAERRRQRYIKKHHYDPPPDGWMMVWAQRIGIPVSREQIDTSLKFDCENRAIDYLDGQFTDDEIREFHAKRARRDVEYSIEVRGDMGAVTPERVEE